MISDILSIAFKLFVLMNPVGNVPLFISLLKHFKIERQRVIVLRESFIVLIFLTIFCVFGSCILEFLDITVYATKIAGGIVLSFSAMQMMFKDEKEKEEDSSALVEPFCVPIAIPFLCGGGVISGLISFTKVYDLISLEIAVIISSVATFCVLYSSTTLVRILGHKGIVAVRKIAGLFVLLVATQLIVDSIDLAFFRRMK